MSRIQQKIYQAYQEIRPSYETQEKKRESIYRPTGDPDIGVIRYAH